MEESWALAVWGLAWRGQKGAGRKEGGHMEGGQSELGVGALLSAQVKRGEMGEGFLACCSPRL